MKTEQEANLWVYFDSDSVINFKIQTNCWEPKVCTEIDWTAFNVFGNFRANSPNLVK